MPPYTTGLDCIDEFDSEWNGTARLDCVDEFEWGFNCTIRLDCIDGFHSGWNGTAELDCIARWNGLAGGSMWMAISLEEITASLPIWSSRMIIC